MDFFGDPLVPLLWNNDSRSLYDRIGCQELQIVFTGIVREEDDRLGGDGEVVADIRAARIGEDIGFDTLGKRVYISCHRGKVFVEGAARISILGEKEEVLCRIPQGDHCKCCPCEKEHSDFHAGRLSFDPFAEGEEWHCGDEKNKGKGADRAKGVRESFFGQKFRDKHRDEATQEKERDQEVAIAVGVAPSAFREEEETHREENDTGEEECSRYEVEQWIGRVIVPPVHIADKGVFDEREAESFCKREREIAMVYLGRENGDGGRTRGEVFGMSREFIQNRRCRNDHAEEKNKGVLPEKREKVFVGKISSDCEEDENEGRDAEGDIGVEAKAEDEAACEKC